jgi:hypothetical protein
MATGEKAILMEDVCDDSNGGGVQAGYAFGPHSPHNWVRDVDAIASDAGMNAEAITQLAFSVAARLHGPHWGDQVLLRMSWLRGAAWVLGDGRDTWEASQALVRQMWFDAGGRARIALLSQPQLIAFIDASLAKVSWDAFQQALHARKWTLVHGDCHPANMIYRPAERRIVLLDWEVVGIGSGAQELGQFVISHMIAPVRRLCEVRLVRGYYDEMVRIGAGANASAMPSWDECWHEYVHGGIARWVWLFAYMSGAPSSAIPDKAMSFFTDQLLTFITDHNVTPATIEMPRA